jgi:diguanylate cyclase (GGDEF)-like protein/PAS domain S-box-containing protein
VSAAAVKVLVVDDQTAFRRLVGIWLHDALRPPGEVVEAATLQEMREAVAAGMPDVVLMDQRLPDGAGIDGARELLAADPDAAVILLTGMSDPLVDAEAERAGVADFLVKDDVDGRLLARAVRYAHRRRQDALALRRSEAEQQRQSAALQRAQEIAGVGSWTWDTEDDTVGWSPELYRLVGVDPADGAPSREGFLALVVDEDRRRVRAAVQAVLDGGPPDETELTLRRPDGELRILRSRFRRVTGPDGRGARVEGVLRDVTEQRAAEAELAEVQLRYRLAFESAASGVAVLAPDARVLEVNEAAARMLGRSVEELVGADGLAYVAPDERDIAAAEMAAALAGGERHGRYERRFVHADGRIVTTLMTTALALDDDGTPRYFTLQLIDITEMRAAQEAIHAGREHYRLVLANLPRAIVAVLDTDLRMLSVGGGALSAVDGRTRSLVGRRLDEFLDEESRGVLEPMLRRALDGEEVTLDFRTPRSARDLEVGASPYRDAGGAIVGIIVVARDVTEERAAERRRRAAERRFEIAFDRAPIGMSLATVDGRLVRVNEAWTRLTGYGDEHARALSPLAYVHPEDAARVSEALGGLADGPVALEHRIAHLDGRTVWVQVRATLVHEDDGIAPKVLAQVEDVTERRRYEDRLQHLADHDPLTGLLNRRGFATALETHLTHTRRYGPQGALLIVDLDGFKYINDTLGHSAGDELIIGCARALRSRLRESDVLARLGGDEFAVLLPGEDVVQAERVAGALVDEVRRHAAGFGGRYAGSVTASIGVAPFTAEVSTAEDMLVNADLAMYEAKEAGKDGHAVYRADAREQPLIKAQMAWLQRIESALEDDRFVLHAQPIVDLARGEVVQHEALLRMVDEDGTLIPPGAFLEVAERFGVIRKIDAWVLRQAIRTMGAARKRGLRLPLAVNVSGVSAADPELVDLIATELAAAGVVPSDLVVELTETAAVADIPRARAFAESVRGLGCRFALDDFGAGFGAFSYLKHLPLDVLKIDGEFVKSATENAIDRLVISAVTEIARGLGKQTVAEFVPDDPTIELLLRHGVDLGQGYHLGRPRPLAELLLELDGQHTATAP